MLQRWFRNQKRSVVTQSVGFASLLLIRIANKLTNTVSSELEGFRMPKQAKMKGNIVKMVQKLNIVSLICIDRVSEYYQLYVKYIGVWDFFLFGRDFPSFSFGKGKERLGRYDEVLNSLILFFFFLLLQERERKKAGLSLKGFFPRLACNIWHYRK